MNNSTPATVDNFEEIYVIPNEKAQPIIDKIKELRRKHPHFSNQRILRKTAEYFKLVRR